MPLEEVISGFTFQGFATLPPTIPGLLAMGIFGTTKDGKNGNRVTGGPAFTNLNNPPTYGSGWVTVNSGLTATPPTQGLDLGVVEDTALIAAGWTVFCIARTAITNGNSTIMCIGPGQTTACMLNRNNVSIGNKPSFWVSGPGQAFVGTENMIDISPRSCATFGMYAVSYPPGSGARPYKITDVTAGYERTTTYTISRTVVGAPSTNHFCLGNNPSNVSNVQQFGDIPAAGVTSGQLSLAQLQSIRTWLLGPEGLRGVTGF